MIRKSILALGLCAALSLGSPVHAKDVMQIRVSVDDLNLRTQSGNGVLLRRLGRAASRICGDDFSHDLKRLAASDKCRLGLNAIVDGTRDAGPLSGFSESLRKSASVTP